ncbi:MAG: GTP-binding protein [Candidatus Lokiarchaeota archaeon]|nr:GTP-binding protein [Candidatus Lokiarchaeota archaeon]
MTGELFFRIHSKFIFLKGEETINSKIDYTYKIAIFGERNVGKTSLITRYITDTFEVDTKPTLGAAIHVKYIKMKDKTILLQIWDFGGEDKYRFLLPSYAYGTFGAIFMYDISKIESLANFREWISVFKSGLKKENDDIPILLVGGKLDLENSRTCLEQEKKNLLDTGIFFGIIECSSMTNENINQVFELLLKEIINTKGNY